jgi:hypothetical protein
VSQAKGLDQSHGQLKAHQADVFAREAYPGRRSPPQPHTNFMAKVAGEN